MPAEDPGALRAHRLSVRINHSDVHVLPHSLRYDEAQNLFFNAEPRITPERGPGKFILHTRDCRDGTLQNAKKKKSARQSTECTDGICYATVSMPSMLPPRLVTWTGACSRFHVYTRPSNFVASRRATILFAPFFSNGDAARVPRAGRRLLDLEVMFASLSLSPLTHVPHAESRSRVLNVSRQNGLGLLKS